MAVKPPITPKRPTNLIRLTVFWVIFVIGILTVVALMSPHDNLKDVPISTVISEANKGNISKIEVQGDNLKVTPRGEDQAKEKSTKDSSSRLKKKGLNSDETVDKVISVPANKKNV